MLVLGTFEHSMELEQALAMLEANGIASNKILVNPMDTAYAAATEFSHIAIDANVKNFEVGMACATGASVIGTSMGYILAWGPIFWGLFAAFIGFAAGVGMYHFREKTLLKTLPKQVPEIVIIVQCEANQTRFVMETLWKYNAITVGSACEPCSKTG